MTESIGLIVAMILIGFIVAIPVFLAILSIPRLKSKSLDDQISELENQIDNQEIEMLK